jgi:hypothetical protein
MLNQAHCEGYLTHAWEYCERRYMRLANRVYVAIDTRTIVLL